MSRVKTVPEARASGVSRRRTAKGLVKALAGKLKGRNSKTEPFVPKAGVGSHNRYANGGRAKASKG